MKLGIIGKPQSGKTTVFNAASGQSEAVGDYSQASHRAVIKVPDERVDKLAEFTKPRKVTFAEIEFLDAPGFSGKGKGATDSEINPELRLMDALVIVVDRFSQDCDPAGDVQDLIDEMILADQVVIENNIEKKSRKAKLTGDKTATTEIALLNRCLAAIEQEDRLINLELTGDEEKMLRGYTFLTQKPLLVVINISEDDISKSAEILKEYAHLVSPEKRELAVLCGKIEMELSEIEDEERASFLQDLGISTPAVDLVVQKSYGLLGLISFLTAGEPEVRAWTIKKNTPAVKAAGAIHSDIERGFIRAEIVTYSDYVEYKTLAAAKAAGKARLEGKEYIVRDGDVILFRFNV